MPRPREFEEHEVLDRALNVFWRLGYDGSAVSDLVTATGLQRQSLYNAFGDKQGLFVATLARYRQHVSESLVELGREDADIAALRRYMERVLEAQRKGGFGACLLVKSAFGDGPRDPRVRAAIEAGAGAVRNAFAGVIERLRNAGQLRSTVDPVATASYLYTVLNGLSALARTGGKPRQIADVLTLTFNSLPLSSGDAL